VPKEKNLGGLGDLAGDSAARGSSIIVPMMTSIVLRRLLETVAITPSPRPVIISSSLARDDVSYLDHGRPPFLLVRRSGLPWMARTQWRYTAGPGDAEAHAPTAEHLV